MPFHNLLLFIPMYNCEKQIKRVIAQIDSSVSHFITEILVVDNISKDNSLKVAKESLETLKLNHSIKTTLIQNKENYNLGGSHKVAFNYAIENNFDHIIVLHGDDQGTIKDILPYLQDGSYKKYDSLLGSRFMSGSKLIGYSWFRTAGNILVNLCCSIGVKKPVFDMGSGLNLYNVNFLKKIKDYYIIFPNNLTFNVYLLFYSIYIRSKLLFFPIEWREDDQVSNAKIFKQGFHILGMIIKYIFCKKCIFNKSQLNNYKYEFNQK
jgi:glycosyltransferase involved in cell wall biosynthesis